MLGSVVGGGVGEVKLFFCLFMSSSDSSPDPRAVADLALEELSSGRDGKGPSPPRVSMPDSSRSEGTSGQRLRPHLDALLLVGVLPSLSYNALHSIFRRFGTVLRIRLVYDDDCSSNRCYVIFASGEEAQSAFAAVSSLPVAGPGFKADLLRSSNVAEDVADYVPNIFEEALGGQSPRASEVHLPRWFLAHYRDGRGNFIRAARYLAKEIGTIPDANLKKYGKGVLVMAKDVTQAKMLQHFTCAADSLFETVKPHPTFNYCKGCVYNHDLYEFSEEDILSMCPGSVHKVSKIRGSADMILLTFYGSSLPVHVRVGPLHLRVRQFVDRPLQCFSCFGYGHGSKNCTEAPRCGNCSQLDAHSTAECTADAYCFYCREGHQLRSRQCPRYRLEQDILQLANSQFISIGSARRELLYRQRDGSGAKSYASALGARSSAPPAPVAQSSSSGTSGSSVAVAALGSSNNRFSPLSSAVVEPPLSSVGAPPALPLVPHAVEIRASRSASPTSSKGVRKRDRGSTESVASVHGPPHKVSVAIADPDVTTPQSMEVAMQAPLQRDTPSPDVAPVTPGVARLAQDLDFEAPPRDGASVPCPPPVSGARSDSKKAAESTLNTLSRAKFKPHLKYKVPEPGSSRVPPPSPVGPSRPPVSGVRSNSKKAAESTLNTLSRAKFKPHLKYKVPEPGSSRVPPPSPVGPSRHPSRRHPEFSGRVGTGRSHPGAHPKPGSK